MPLLELLGEAQHRIRACNAGAIPALKGSWHPLCHRATQFFLENSDDVGLPDQTKQSRVIPRHLGTISAPRKRDLAQRHYPDLANPDELISNPRAENIQTH
jgi:hypothetical protein